MPTILIATPLYPPDVGGPSYYAKHLASALEAYSHRTRIAVFSRWSRLPSVIRHVAYFFGVLGRVRGASCIVILDAFSAALPAVLVGKITGTRTILRVSGYFLWERFIEQTGSAIPFSRFYESRSLWSWKDRVLFYLVRFVLRRADGLVFQNEWQRRIFADAYGLLATPSRVIRNCFLGVSDAGDAARKNFLWAGRDIRIKNRPRLLDAFKRVQQKDPSVTLETYTDMPQKELFTRMKNAYAIIVPSISEMNPNLILEGLAFGKPFICTKETGVSEVVSGLGIFVDPLDTNAITDAVIAMAQPETYRQFRDTIRAFSYRHTYADIAGEFMEFYRSIPI